jgi:hypothetical protein
MKMTKVALGLSAACALMLMTAPARASDFSDACASAITGMTGQPEGPDMKAGLDKKFSGNAGNACGCMEIAIKSNPKSTTGDQDLVSATAYAAAVSAILDKGGTGKDVDKMTSEPANQASAGFFMLAMFTCVAA